MKYGKEWSLLRRSLPDGCRSNLIDYINWKEKTRQYDDGFLSEIELECDNIDKFYSTCVRRLMKNKNGNTELGKEYTADNVDDLITINKKTLYKLCKRFDKKSGLDKVFSFWFQNIAKNKYKFLKTDLYQKYIDWKVNKTKETCPICLEKDYDTFVIQKCGHIICTPCISTMASSCRRNQNQGNALKGTTHNIIKNFQFYNICACPLCRTKKALSEFIIIRS